MWAADDEITIRAQKTYRDEHRLDCESLFFWMAEDVQIARGGVRNVPGTPVRDLRGSWSSAVGKAHGLNPDIPANLLFHDLRRSGVRVMVQDAGIPEAQAMLISGHDTRSMLERYNIVSLKNVLDAGAKLDAWQKGRKSTRSKRSKSPQADVVPMIRRKSLVRSKSAKTA